MAERMVHASRVLGRMFEGRHLAGLEPLTWLTIRGVVIGVDGSNVLLELVEEQHGCPRGTVRPVSLGSGRFLDAGPAEAQA